MVQPREWYGQCKRDKAVVGVNTVVGYPPEKVAATIVGIQEPSIALSLSHGEFLSTEIISWVDMFQLTRTFSQKQNYRGGKAK